MTADLPDSDSTAVLPLTHALLLPRIAIESTSPVLEGGQFAVKATVGQQVNVSSTVFVDGHDQLAVRLHWRKAAHDTWRTATMQCLGNDSWAGHFEVPEPGRYVFCIEAWVDRFASFCHELDKKHQAGVPMSLELQHGRVLVQHAIERSTDELQQQLQALLRELSGLLETEQVALFLHESSAQLMAQAQYHAYVSLSPEYPVEVERHLAAFASWYELFACSVTDDPAGHGTFNDVHARLPMIHDMGFDVVVLPAIHRIDQHHPAGPNNTLQAGPDEPGSPSANGSEEGRQAAIHPQWGTRDDFRRMVAAAAAQGLEVALDFAVQCSPDHPWLTQHPGWFNWRPDGTIGDAQNPSRKYPDSVNVDFYAPHAIPGLWLELRARVLGWVDEGVTLFRVANPHTQPLPFWQWLIAEVRGLHNNVIFLAQACTTPAMMARLGKVGYSQSDTYLCWRHTKAELCEYFTELNQSPWRECFRPHFFVNTPDIHPQCAQGAGRTGFLIRAALATMGSGLWGMYSGFERCEAQALSGKNECPGSGKSPTEPCDLNAPGDIVAEIAQLNRIRRQNPALHSHLGLRLYNAWNDHLLYFGKRTADGSNFVLVVINLDPHNAQEAHFELPLWEMGLADDAPTAGEDLMTGHRWTWYGKHQWTRLDPSQQPFGIWRIKPL